MTTVISIVISIFYTLSAKDCIYAWFHLHNDFTSRHFTCSHFAGWRNWSLKRFEDISSPICLWRKICLVCSSLWVRKNELLLWFYSDFWESQFQCLWHLAVVSPPRPDPSQWRLPLFRSLKIPSSAINALSWSFMSPAFFWMALSKCGEFWIYVTVLIYPTLH